MSKDELLDLVDGNDNVIGEVWKSEAHSDPSKIHREIAIAVFNQKGEVLIQQRSLKKKTGPGEWKVSAAGHVEAGEDPKKACVREVKEELGIRVDPIYFTKSFVEDSKHNESKFYWIYYAIVTDTPDLLLDDDEVADVKWIRPEDLIKFSKENDWDIQSTSHKMIMDIYGYI